MPGAFHDADYSKNLTGQTTVTDCAKRRTRDAGRLDFQNLEFLVSAIIAELSTDSWLLRQLDTKQARIAVIGLGYVGLPLAVGFAKAGFRVFGIDNDASKIDSLSRGQSYIGDVSNFNLEPLIKKETFQPTTDAHALAEADIIIICVPTPLRKTKEPDISYILSAAGKVKENLRAGQLIVLESTTYPGTTEEVVLPMLEETGLRIDEDFLLAFSPERVDPGNRQFDTSNIPKVVGGVTPLSTKVATHAYGKIVGSVHPVSSARVAETTNLLENTFRSVNIGLVNEIARLCRTLDIDTWEVIEAAATKPFGFMPFYPGPGLGGHCIPIDPHYLSWKARLQGFEARFIDLAEEVNSQMPDFVVQLASDALNDRCKPIKGSRILMLGVAYKSDVSDIRESPAIAVMEKFLKKGAVLDYNDPYVDTLTLDSMGRKEFKNVPIDGPSLHKYDCVVITTNHKGYDYQEIVDNAPLVIDTRNATRSTVLKDGNVVRL